MTDIVHYLAGALPYPVREYIKGTILDDFYQSFRYRRQNFETVEFDTPVGPIRLELPENDSFKRHAEKPNGHEPVLVADLAENLTGMDVFYDIGSHYGYMLEVAMETTGRPENVHAFESNSFRYRVLQQKYGSKGVGVNHARVTSEHVDAYESTVDRYAERNESPDVIKMDIEGAEYDALMGSRTTLEDSHPALYIEVHPTRIGGFEYVRDLYELLVDYGYELSEAERFSERMKWSAAEPDPRRSDPYLLRAE